MRSVRLFCRTCTYLNYRSDYRVLHRLKPVLACQQQRVFSSCCTLSRISSSSVMDSATEKGEWQQRKQETLNMPIERRRELYRCGADRAVSIDSIPAWPEYAAKEKLVEASAEPDEKATGLAKKISLFKGDITCLEIDAVVNAANESLLGGGGVDGAIHKAAGYMLYDECYTLDGCDTGDAKISGGYNLPAKYVIHTVGPQSKHSDVLASCYTRSLDLARQNKLRTIAFPCISTGVYGYPHGPACQTALKTVRKWLEAADNGENIDRIIFCVFLDIDVRCYRKYMPIVFPLTSSESNKSSATDGREDEPSEATESVRRSKSPSSQQEFAERSTDAHSPKKSTPTKSELEK